MEEHAQEHRDYGFIIGVLAGTFIGAGLAVLFLPRSGAELRHRISDSARGLGERASDQYHKVSARAGETLDRITREGRDVRDNVADAVAHGAHEVERYARAAKTDRAADIQKDPAVPRSL